MATVADSWEITLPYKRPPLSLNDRMHWAKKAALTKLIRAQTAALVRAKHIPACDRIDVTLHWQPDTIRPRDSDNPVATLKPAIDGIRDAGVVVDDAHARVHSGVHIHDVHRGDTARVWLHIERVA